MFIRKNLIKNNLTKDNRGNDKGFTLAELLIVVAIIAVLVAISIPIFMSQLEKSREATDLANVRAKYAEMMELAIAGDEPEAGSGITHTGTTYTATVTLKQTQADWQTGPKDELDVGGVKFGSAQWTGTPGKGGTCVLTVVDEIPNLNWSGGAAGGAGTTPPMTQADYESNGSKAVKKLSVDSNVAQTIIQNGGFVWGIYDPVKDKVIFSRGKYGTDEEKEASKAEYDALEPYGPDGKVLSVMINDTNTITTSWVEKTDLLW